MCGPYRELLDLASPKRYVDKNLDKRIAAKYKNDAMFQRIRTDLESSKLLRFDLEGDCFELLPGSLFYDYLHVNAVPGSKR